LANQAAEAEKHLAAAEQLAAASGNDLNTARAVLAERLAAVPEPLRSPEALDQEKRRVSMKLKQMLYALEAAQQAAKEVAVRAATAAEALKAADELAAKTAELAAQHRREFDRRLTAEGFT